MRYIVYLIGSEICILDSINDRCVVFGIIILIDWFKCFFLFWWLGIYIIVCIYYYSYNYIF